MIFTVETFTNKIRAHFSLKLWEKIQIGMFLIPYYFICFCFVLLAYAFIWITHPHAWRKLIMTELLRSAEGKLTRNTLHIFKDYRFTLKAAHMYHSRSKKCLSKLKMNTTWRLLRILMARESTQNFSMRLINWFMVKFRHSSIKQSVSFAWIASIILITF